MHFLQEVNERIDLPQGTLDLLILRTLSLESQHGWGISERVQQVSSDVLRIQQGSRYPALHRLERRGWIKAPLGHVGQQPARQVLRIDQGRAWTIGRGEGFVAKAHCRGGPSSWPGLGTAHAERFIDSFALSATA